MFLRFRGLMKIFAVYALGLSGVNFGISGDVSAQPVPEFYGIYAVDNGRLHELEPISDDRDDRTEDLAKKAVELSANARFIVFDKRVASIAPNIKLYRLAFLRNKVYIELDARPETKSARYWSSFERGEVELRSKPVEGQSEMVYLVPRTLLRAGAYNLVLIRESVGAFVVDNKSVLSNPESSEHCVDLEIDFRAGKMGSWLQREIPCAQSGVQVTSQPSSPNVKTSKPGVKQLSSKQPIAAQQLDMPVFNRTFSAPFEELWASVLRVLEEQKDQKETVDKSAGVVRTKPSRHGGFFNPYYAKYEIQVTSEDINSSKVTLGVERYKRDMECKGCSRVVKLIPDTTKLRAKRMKESADDFFSKLEAQLR